jgi:hypothetical protein
MANPFPGVDPYILLLAGRRPPMAAPLPPGDYYAFVARAGRRPDCDVYAWSIRRALPAIPIPLRPPDPDVLLDLAAVYATAHENGRNARRLDYAAPWPSPSPPTTAPGPSPAPARPPDAEPPSALRRHPEEPCRFDASFRNWRRRGPPRAPIAVRALALWQFGAPKPARAAARGWDHPTAEDAESAERTQRDEIAWIAYPSLSALSASSALDRSRHPNEPRRAPERTQATAQGRLCRPKRQGSARPARPADEDRSRRPNEPKLGRRTNPSSGAERTQTGRPSRPGWRPSRRNEPRMEFLQDPVGQ